MSRLAFRMWSPWKMDVSGFAMREDEDKRYDTCSNEHSKQYDRECDVHRTSRFYDLCVFSAHHGKEYSTWLAA